MMDKHWTAMHRQTTLLPSEYMRRFTKCKSYLKRLRQENLLLYYEIEAGLFHAMRWIDGLHGGWDSPTSHARGMFTGHWLSAASMAYASDRDAELRLRIDDAVDILARCQEENGNGWAFAVPEKQLLWLRRGGRAVNCLYSFHKTMMGYMDAFLYAGSSRALDIMRGCADYFYRWSDDIPRREMDRIMDDFESGGILEVWAQLYAETHDEKHLALMRRFERPRLYEALLEGRDFLTNMHANTTIPEILGAAACYEATGEERYRRVVEAYWDQAVTRRGMYATGGQTCGEIWTPAGELMTRLGELNQEHCTVYNMIRMADALLRWTGDMKYADYIERNLKNGVLAQTFLTARSVEVLKDPYPPREYLVSYFLPMGFGVTKKWGTETDDFWCCHGSAVQANAQFTHRIFYETPDGIALGQYIPARLELGEGTITIEQADMSGEHISLTGVRAAERPHRPDTLEYVIRMDFPQEKEFTLLLPMPWWLSAPARVDIDGENVLGEKGRFLAIRRAWRHQTVTVRLPKTLTAEPLPGEPGVVAFMDGPLVLAGLTDGQYALRGDMRNPRSILRPHEERWWSSWRPTWRTIGQTKTIVFVPVQTITEERYNIYFPVSE